jgi:hypothetical protein
LIVKATHLLVVMTARVGMAVMMMMVMMMVTDQVTT